MRARHGSFLSHHSERPFPGGHRLQPKSLGDLRSLGTQSSNSALLSVVKVRLILTSSAGSGEARSKVEATPPGFGRWDLLLYLLPFLGAGFLRFSAISKRRRARRLRLQQST